MGTSKTSFELDQDAYEDDRESLKGSRVYKNSSESTCIHRELSTTQNNEGEFGKIRQGIRAETGGNV
jgi:hypothetical protein